MGIIHHKSGPRTPIRNRTERIIKEWGVLGRWKIPLANVLHGRHGRRHGNFLYTVYYGDMAMYTGVTRKTIHNRISNHIKYHSNLGECITYSPIEMLSIDVMEIEGNIWLAERQRIQQLRPPLNIAEHYHTQKKVTKVVQAINPAHTPIKSTRPRRKKSIRLNNSRHPYRRTR